MPPRRIFVTGGHGFVGRHLLPRLRAAFHGVEIVAPRMPELDVTHAAAVADLVDSIAPDACVHLAAIAAIPAARQNPETAWRVNLHGTLNVAEALRRHAPACVLLYPSSADAYGKSFRRGVPLDETAPLAPQNIYGATKAAADLALGVFAADGFRAVIARPFNHTGPGQSADFVVPAFARQVARIEARRQAPILRVGALGSFRDFLDVRDVCDAYVAALARADTLAPGTILNIASGTPRRVGDILDALIRLAGISATVETGAGLLRAAEIETASGNADAARAALSWSPAIAWETTLRDILDDWRARVRAEAG